MATIASLAAASGHDPAKAQLVWDTCAAHIRGLPKAGAGETPAQRRRRIRREEAELRKKACAALGITLLTILLNWALGKLINWVLDRIYSDAVSLSSQAWADQYETSIKTLWDGPPRLGNRAEAFAHRQIFGIFGT